MRLSYNSPVILSFTLLSASVLLLDRILGGGLVLTGFAVPARPDLFSPIDWFRLFSHIAGHQDWEHLTSNFALILLIGPVLEEKYSSTLLLKMMMVTALATGALNACLFSTGLMGASGIAFMLILLSSFTNIRSGQIPLTFILIVGLFLTKEVVNVFQEDGVSQFAHIMGGVSGSIFGFFYTRQGSIPRGGKPFRAVSRPTPERQSRR